MLEPLYKLFSATISEHPKALERVLAELGVALKSSQYGQVRLVDTLESSGVQWRIVARSGV